jgi:hypothetical protein
VCRIRWVSLSVRRDLLWNYVESLTKRPTEPSYKVLLHLSFRDWCHFLTSAPPTEGARLQNLLPWLGIQLPHIIPHTLPPFKPRDIIHPTCYLGLNQISSRHNVSSHILSACRSTARRIGRYSDGLFLQASAGSAFVYDGQVSLYRLHDLNRVLTFEIYAVYKALLSIHRQPWRHDHVLSDSVIGVQSLSGCRPCHPLITQILLQVSDLRTSGLSVVFCWVPRHSGLSDSGAADAAAMSGLLVSDRDLALFYLRGKPNGTMPMAENCVWWNHLYRSGNPASEPPTDEVTFTSHWIGCTCLTHGHLLRDKQEPFCTNCSVHQNLAQI